MHAFKSNSHLMFKKKTYQTTTFIDLQKTKTAKIPSSTKDLTK